MNLAAGWHAVESALQTGQSVSGVYIDDARSDERVHAIESLAEVAGVPVHLAPKAQLDDMAAGVRHQGCLAQVQSAKPLDEGGLLALVATLEQPFILVLDQVQDPHNLGACLRSAAAAGVHAVVVPSDNAVGLTATARKVAAGGAELVPLARVTNLARTLRALQAQNIWLVGMADEAETPLYQVDLRGGLALVLGSEGSGLRRLTGETCDALVGIPMTGGVASLNVSVATGVCLFEALRQRQ